MKILIGFVLALVFGMITAGVTVYTGMIDVGADIPHSKPVHSLISIARERSIKARVSAIEVPALDDDSLVASGAEHYVAMCVGCHLEPGQVDSELRMGLYPTPPKLAAQARAHGHDHGDAKASAARQFWIIKHGVKATGMPAWGLTHDDESIWGIVAFLQKLPELSKQEYQALTANAGAHAHGTKEHSHGGDGTGHEQVESAAEPPSSSSGAQGAGSHTHSHNGESHH